MTRLNRHQRLLLAIGAAVIAMLLVVQINYAGFEKSNWLLGSLIIVALLFLALMGSSESPGNAKASDAKFVSESSESTKDDNPALDRALADAKQQFSELFQSIFEKAAPPGISVDFGLPMGPATDHLAWKAAFMIVLLALSKRHRGFEESTEASKLAAKTAVEVASSTKRLQAAIDGRQWSINELTSAETQKYLQEVVECRFRVVRTMRHLAQNADHPLDPIFSLISREFPFSGSTPEERERAYGPLSRNLMRDLTR